MKWDKIIYPALAAIFTASLFWLWDVAKGVPTILTPGGAVVAFDLSVCPDGWDNFNPAAGRTIVGVGRSEELTERTLLERGGSETHTLTIAEIPPHTHSGNIGTGGASFEHHQFNDRPPLTGWNSTTGSTGGGETHNIMQPFVAPPIL